MAYIGARIHGLGCKQCPRGTYVKPDLAPGKSQTDCQSCPQGTYLKDFAKFRACRCMKDYFRLDRFGPCFTCTKGYACVNETIELSPGFYWVWKGKQLQQNYELFKNELNIQSESKVRAFEGAIPEAHACPNAASCLGGKTARCALGYSGPLCAVCDKGYYHLMAKCQKCPSLPWIAGQIILMVLVLIILVIIVLWEKKKTENQARSLTDIILARLKIVIGFYQVSSSTFDSFTYISVPGPVITIMKYAKLVQLNLLQIAPLNCISDTVVMNSYTHFSVTLTFTVVVVVLGTLAILLIRTFGKRTSGNNPQDRRMKFKHYQEKCFRCFFLFLFITFPSTSTQVFQMLPAACHRICSYSNQNCNSYLRADYSVACNTERHQMFSAASTTALLYCFGFPLVLFIVLKHFQSYKAKNDTSSLQASVVYSGIRFLYENYSQSCYFWEITELTRKVAFSAILILMDAESRLSLGVTAILSELYTVFFALSKPIEDGFEHWLQIVSLISSSVNFTIGMLMKIPKEESSSGVGEQADALIVTILLVTANVAVIFIVSVKYLSGTLNMLIDAKKNRECSVSCCLETLQLVTGAHDEITSIHSQPKICDSVYGNTDERPTLGDVKGNIQELVMEEPAVEDDEVRKALVKQQEEG